MSPVIHERVEAARGCGYRKQGGLYLVADGLSTPCGRLPVPLERCPCCDQGIKPTRGWTWVDGWTLLHQTSCVLAPDCGRCALADPLPHDFRCGLLWIGGQFYRRPDDWTNEARAMGVSRRVPAVPKGLVVGKTWVLVVHREAIEVGKDGDEEPTYKPGIFHAFRPGRIEYVVKDDDTDEALEALEKRGITLVRVTRQVAPLEILGHRGEEEVRA